MTGDTQDMLARLKAVLPRGWFADDTPILDAVLTGLASSWSWLYGLLQSAIAQTRIATASGAFLDMIAADFFGTRLVRRSGQSDTSFRAAIDRELLRDRATRAALVSLLTDLTGRTPVVFEPSRPADTGAWGQATGYGSVGAWGSLALPFQCFVTAYRPLQPGVATVAGWGEPSAGWGNGPIEYANLGLLQDQVTDAQIDATIAGALPVATIAWTRISN